ncbi:hypothetical protein [Kitasatospora sp. NBC_00458]|uniref:hypothetical protein n=1 Tax=Kitasatospora sp. NBC_00458 TaxID=2903568 RepID=UPI002E18C3F5
MSKPAVLVLAALLVALIPCAARTEPGGPDPGGPDSGAPCVAGYFGAAPLDGPVPALPHCRPAAGAASADRPG